MSLFQVISTKLPSLSGRCLCSATFKNFSTTQALSAEKKECNVLIVGGGAGGCALAAKLSSKLGKDNVIVIEPSDKHYYQPMFTLIGGGMKRLDHSYKLMANVLPKKVRWVKDRAVNFDPKNNTVSTANGTSIRYDMLLIATGLQLNYDKIPGLVEALSIPNGKVCSIYSPKYVDRTYQCLRNIEDGNAIFTYPSSPVKCPGAPQKILYIAEHYFRKLNKRKNINVIYNTSLPVIFGVKHYADALWKIIEKRDIKVNLRRNLIEIKPESDTAIFQNLDNPSETFVEKYNMLHVVPPMSSLDELAKCKELVNEAGFVDVDKDTMQHVTYKNVFAIGDCASSPNSKTAAAAAAQSPVVYHNMIAALNGKPLKGIYDGYASCPLVTGYNKCILAEFDYNLTPLETFPFPQNKERYTMFIMKKDFMPTLYWQMMLKGYWNGPALMRNMMSVFKFGK
ncbi:sulfide:quinone oxidoreductase, mitochondrial-like isoform X2 [Teleopsis dalmanni]|uniref:sulfide:quinone oxidoreductase, mitochondrial-like isoform X2 n=1 Tax=Teleopsis dalmanni TaxID=139649 RepID=UPI0018CD487F|nr:sulfide:quinone oxidoreductase, mitochondrial-like isoform X2 [Teleopsis dalmanni]